MEGMKVTLSVTVDEDLVEWIKKEAKNGQYRNSSHLVEVALKQFRENKQRKE